MDTPLYDVYLTGKLAANTDAAAAAQRLAALFRTTPDVTAGMLTGKPHLLKRAVDKTTALKYRDALAAAGVEVAFKGQAAAGAAPAEPPRSDAAPAAPSLAPPGSEVLRASERAHPVAVDVDTSELQLAPVGPLPAAPAAAVATPDISHLSLAAAAGDLLSAAEKQQPAIIVPAAGDFTLAPAGAILETLHPDAPPLRPDLSALSLAPAGTELLTAEQRAKPIVDAPNTDHLKLAN